MARRPGRFPRSWRLTSTARFRQVQAGGERIAAGDLVVLWMPNTLGHWRLGLVVSRRVGGAVVRNRLKRRLREAFRLKAWEDVVGADVVVIARPAAAKLGFQQLARALGRAMEQIAARLRPGSTVSG